MASAWTNIFVLISYLNESDSELSSTMPEDGVYTYHRTGFDVLGLAGDKSARRSLHPVI